MATKHEQILQYIDKLPIGSKISVRQIAKDLDVSEGTAYRAIKEAETQGYVSTIERVGTVRIEKKQKENIERLTFAEVVNIVDGHVLGGREGLHKTLNKFVIGAMQLEAMMRYIDAGSLLLVGNRFQAHKIALQQGAAVLITGGFDTSEEIKQLADRLALPIISSSYDTFTVASMINRAIYDRLIKKEIVMVEDILKPLAETPVLLASDPVAKWHQYTELYHETRFPVVDEQMRLIGIVTSKDIIGHDQTALVEKVMTKNPITSSPRVSVASSAHTMVWEGIELLPVVDNGRKLVGVLSRNDVLKALQYTAKQPQMSETFPNLIMSHFREERQGEDLVYTGEVTPQMTNHLGTMASGIMTTVMAEVGCNLLRNHRRADMVPENITVYFLKPVQMESKIHVKPRLLDISRRFGKVEVSVYQGELLVGQAMVSAQIIDR
ncbi:DRTGG domain-containing protein [Brevibacillus ruminantium]|uniref:DRTGG domain-containing protein n=1 Tax=Brevibacillus ruminantium TaxID=2950604 RepID=A0ABY4WBA5_9BACL|nr:DRTGG domain-containing protein [Brevibacillus ruminantium]USG64453.1 DRTGG domain-containing protein [Brevibacillus ruminantium]